MKTQITVCVVSWISQKLVKFDTNKLSYFLNKNLPQIETGSTWAYLQSAQ